MKQTGLHSSRGSRLADLIRQDLRDARPGDRIDSVRTISAKRGVCINTVRAALRLLQREGWVTLRHGSGCYVSRRQPTPDRHIAILVELDILRVGISPFFLGIVNRLRRILHERKQEYRLHIGHAFKAEDSCGDPTAHGFLDDLKHDHVSGVLAVATLPKSKIIEPLNERGIPIVGMDSRWDFFGGSVNLDYPGMLRLGVETLISKGCRKLAMVGWGYRWVGDAGEMDDFRKTVEAHGLDFRPDWVQTSMAPAKGSGWEDLREVWRASRTRPDGLLIADDMLLPDVDLAIRELGLRVPDQLQVVLATSRDLPHQASFPLTRIENDMDDFGDKMVEILFDLMAGRQPATRQFVVGYRVAQEGAQRGVSSGGRAVAAVSSGAGSAVPSRVGREG